MHHHRLPAFVCCLLAAARLASAVEVHPDRTVTFTYTGGAQSVVAAGDFGPALVLEKKAEDVFTATTPPLEPNLYSYRLMVDGKPLLDPLNNRFKPERTGASSVIDVPGDKPNVWDWQPKVSHGVVHLHEYSSKAAGTLRRLRVYTPPGYESAGGTRYPVLYLFHGSGDNEATWTDFGKAQLILDNLIADGKAKPMIIVMPDGHMGPPVPRNAPMTVEMRGRSLALFGDDLIGDVIPLVDAAYRTQADREHRAIIGLSMGGNQSLIGGLNNPDVFAWVGGMSSAVRDPASALAPFLKEAGQANGRLRLLWFACGKDDKLLGDNQALDKLLTEQNVKHTFVQTAGAHAWPVWRRHLAEFAPLLFR